VVALLFVQLVKGAGQRPKGEQLKAAKDGQ
jgi:hypothetical protein